MKITLWKDIPLVYIEASFILNLINYFILPAVKFAILFLNHTLKNKLLKVNSAMNLPSVELCGVEMYNWTYKLLSKHQFCFEYFHREFSAYLFHRKPQIWTNIVSRCNRFLKKFWKISEVTLTRPTTRCVYIGDFSEIFLTYLFRNT